MLSNPQSIHGARQRKRAVPVYASPSLKAATD